MDGKREEIRKGPWKAEEDEVLINHVKRCRPETGAPFDPKDYCSEQVSCLFSGCKFSLEAERIVIKLQAQFGNKWNQKFKAIMEEESSLKAQLPVMVNPKLIHFGANYSHLQLTAYENNPYTESQLQINFHQIPYPQQDLTFSLESQELLATLEDPCFSDVFGPVDGPELNNEAQLPVEQPFLKPETSCMNGGKDRNNKSVNSDALCKDFPTDMFDHIEPLPSPSTW